MPLLPSRRLAFLFAAASLLFLISTPAALVADALIIGAMIFESIRLTRGGRFEVTRSVPLRIPLDGEGVIEITVRDPERRPHEIMWTLDHDLGLKPAGDEVGRLHIPGGVAATGGYRVVGVERGRRVVGDVHLRVLGPHRLLWRRIRSPMRDTIIVQPGLRELRRSRMQALHHHREIGQRRSREIGEGREFERLREYARGDDPRRIDWKATARHGRTIIREYEAERSQNVVLAIDAGRLMAERYQGRERLDHALAAALVLADTAAIQGDAVGAFVFADAIQRFVPPARLTVSGIADALAEVEARHVEPDYPGAFRYLGRQLRRRSLVVLFTDLIDTRASAALLAHLTASARRHLPLMIALRNVELEEAARAPVADEPDVFRRAAAEELLNARVAALATIRRQGVLVADVRPDDIVDQTIARYIEIKQRGML